jgi:hypothetical protein
VTPGFDFVMMLACAVFYYRLGESEHLTGFAAGRAWCWLGASFLLRLGWPAAC